MASGLFGSGPQSNILNTVQSSYTGMLNAEKQKGAGVSAALGAFGEAISPKSIGMRQFKKDFGQADWNDPATYMKAGQQIMQFDTNGGLSMIQKGQAMAAQKAAQAAPNMQFVDVVDSKTGITSKVAVNMKGIKEGTSFTSEIPETVKEEYVESSRVIDGMEVKGSLNKNTGEFTSYEGATGTSVSTGNFVESTQVIDGIKYTGALNKDTGEFTPYKDSTGTPIEKQDAPTYRIDTDENGNPVFKDWDGENWVTSGRPPSDESASERKEREFTQTKALRTELDGDYNYSAYKKGVLQLSKIETSAKQDSAAGDLSLIFAYMKMLDPESVVREGEQATAANATGIDDRIKNLYNKALEGEKMGLNQRRDFVDTATNLLKDIEKEARPSINKIQPILNRYNLNQDDVFSEIDKKIGIEYKLEGLNREDPKAFAENAAKLLNEEELVLFNEMEVGKKKDSLRSKVGEYDQSDKQAFVSQLIKNLTQEELILYKQMFTDGEI